MATIFTLPKTFAVQLSGIPYAAAKLYFYQAGTTTALTVYQDLNLGTPHAQPVRANDQGTFPTIYTDPEGGNYKIQLKTFADVLIYEQDDIPATEVTGPVLGKLLYPQTTAESAGSITPSSYLYPPGDIRRYGAVSGSDSTSALTSALTQAQHTRGAEVFIPAGTWVIASMITVNTAPFKMAGEGFASVLSVTSNITALTLGVNASGSILQDFYLVGPGTGTSTVPGIIFNNCNTNTMRRVKISAFDKGIQFQSGINSCYLNSLYDCQIVSNKTINIDAQGNTNALFLSNCTFGGAPCLGGLKLIDSNNLTVVGGDAEGLSQYVFDLDSSSGTLQAAHIISGFHFEGNTSSVGDVRIGLTAPVAGVTLVGNLYAPGTGNDCAVSLVRGDGVSIIGGDLHSGYSGSGIIQGMIRVAGTFTGTYVVKGVGNVKSTDPVNFKPLGSETFIEATTYDASFADAAQFNSYVANSGSLVTNKNYYAGLDVARLNNSGGAPASGVKLYARAIKASDGIGGSAAIRALLVDGPFDITGLQTFADDAAAAAGGIAVGQLYRNGSIVMIRVS